jgi:hypothetical protein
LKTTGKTVTRKIPGSAYVRLLEDHCDLLRSAYESFLLWETFGDLLRDTRKGDVEYPRIRFFTTLLYSVISSAFDSFVINLYKFYDRRSDALNTLVDTGIKRGRISQPLERRIRAKIERASEFAVRSDISSLRNQHVGHYNSLIRKRSSLTTVHPTPNELRDYFAKLAEILQLCVRDAPLSRSPFRYNHFEKDITAQVGMLVRYLSGSKVPWEWKTGSDLNF